MITRKLASALAALALTGGAALVATVPAMATGNTCPPTTHRDLAAVKTFAKDGVTPTNGTAAVTDRGVRATTPDASAKVYAYFDVKVPLGDVQALGYQTRKHDTATPLVLPSYQLGVDVNGDAEGGFTTLVFEPYLQPAAVKTEWQTWNAFTGRWWSTNPIPGQPTRSDLRVLAQVAADNPDAVVVYYGMSLGSGNAGADARWDRVKFKAKGVCVERRWAKPAATPTATPTATASPTPSATASETPGPVPTTALPVDPTPTGGPVDPDESAGPVPTVSTSPAPGGLALTGANALGIGGGALLMVSVGGLLFVLARRRRTRFEA